jgi:serine/threonine-protein kinase RsbW
MMETGEKYDIKVEGTMDQLPVLADFVESVIRKAGIGGPPAYDIKLAVDEITTNIVKHAYREKKGSIWMTCYRKGDRFYEVIKDLGPAFDPSKMPPPDLTSELEKRKVGGLGIYFVRRVMDSIGHEYRDGMNIVTMTKKIS